jgi:hypothetical protein
MEERQLALCESFDKVLTAFERDEFRAASRELSNILGEWRDDGPSLAGDLLRWTTVRIINTAPQGRGGHHRVDQTPRQL